MTLWKLTLSYDGTAFNGWQVQPGQPTIQGALAAAIERIAGECVLPQGSGRTDAGVHALAQVASFALESPIPPANLLRALNRALPPSIRILAAEIASPNFHARHSALRKTYEYRIFERRLPSPVETERIVVEAARTLETNRVLESAHEPQEANQNFVSQGAKQNRVPQVPILGPGFAETLANPTISQPPERICPPFLAPFVWDCRWSLQLALMQRASALLCGTHDFTSFAASDPDLSLRAADRVPHLSDGFIVAKMGDCAPTLNPEASAPNPTKTIVSSTINRENDLLVYRITGSGFLHHMVRNLVGTLVEIGRGSLAAESIPHILAARDRSAAGPTAPASGLFLVSVDYDEHEVRP